MKLENNKYKVNIQVDEEFSLDDNKKDKYDFIFYPDSFRESYLYKTFSIEVTGQQTTEKISLVGSYYIKNDNCAVLEDDILTVLQNTTITQINLRNHEIITYKEIEDCFCGFEIYKIQDFYIIYGEMEIIRLDNNLNKVWQFSGADIFVTPDEDPAFELCDDRIKARDWQGNYFEIDFDGRVITEVQHVD